MKKIAHVILLSTLIGCSIGVLGFAKEVKKSEAANSPAWLKTAGPDATYTELANGGASITGMTAHGSNFRSTNWYSLDGLSFDVTYSGYDWQAYGGFGFSNTAPKTDGSQLGWQSYTAPNFCFWPNLFSTGQTRIWVGGDHDYNKTTYLFQDEACTKNYAYSPDTPTLVFGLGNNQGLYYGGAHFAFERRPESKTYKVTVSQLGDCAITAYNPNYNASTKSCYFFIPYKNIPCIGLTDHVYLNLSVTSASGAKTANITLTNIQNVNDFKPTNDWDLKTGVNVLSTGYGYKFSGIQGWGQKAVLKTKVHLDGLQFSFKMAKCQPQDTYGFYFTKTSSISEDIAFDKKYSPCFAVSTALGVAGGTFSKLHIGEDHNPYANTSLTYRDEACTKNGFSDSQKDLLIKPTNYENSYYTGFNIQFEKLSTTYRVTITQNTLFGAINESTTPTLFNTGNEKRVLMYIPVSQFEDNLDSSGNCYLTVAGYGGNDYTGNEYFLLDDIKDNTNLFAFLRYFMGMNCDPTGRTAPATSTWNTAASKFNALSNEEKSLFKITKSRTGSQSTTLEQALSRYDYIINKYGISKYSNFMGRDVSDIKGGNALSLLDGFGLNNNATMFTIFGIVAAAEILLVILFKVKKKKGAK